MNLLLTTLACLLLGALALACLGVLLMPLYALVLWHDSVTADARKRELDEGLRLLREIESEQRDAARQ